MSPAVLLRRLLLLPLLAPVLAVLLVGAINPRPWVGLRLLIWRSPEWTIGSWLALAAGGGAALSATATALALQAGGASNQRQLRRPIPEGRFRRAWPWGRGDSAADGPTQTWVDGPGQQPAPAQAGANWKGDGTPWPAQAWAGPSRHPSEPQPTLSVPFRVIRRGTGAGSDSGPIADGPAPAGSGPAAANGWSPAGPLPDPEAAQPGSRRQGLWPLGNRQQAQPAQAPGGPSPVDPAAVDRSWQVGPDVDW